MIEELDVPQAAAAYAVAGRTLRGLELNVNAIVGYSVAVPISVDSSARVGI